MSLLQAFACVAVLTFASCSCDDISPNLDGGAGGGRAGGAGGSSGGTGGSGAGGGAGAGDAGPQVDPNNPFNDQKDTDCDGLSDAEEFGNTYAGGKRTDPTNPDTDGDGILDGVEAGRTTSVEATCQFAGDADATTRTLPTEADSDLDGLADGLEDTNHNGRADNGETDAINPDSDFDTLKDGVEDANHNGVVDPGETDPRRKDTDGDSINDGVELADTITDPTKGDTDGDTCLDGAEDFNQNGVVDPGETNPRLATDCGPANNPDSDGDGLPNSIEDKNGNNVVDPGETDPANPDTDADGLKDGLEDRNKNGQVDPGETNPLRKDSDCDGLLDGPDAAPLKGEDLNADGVVGAAETDPTKFDTDGDGISDGVEKGLTAATRADVTTCANVPFDADPTTTTDPTKADTDGDGISDGAEDTNQNGKVDPGELDPNNPADGNGPAGQVCTAANLRPVLFKLEGEPDLQLGLPATYTEVVSMAVGGTKKGFIGYDAVNKTAFLAWREPARGGATTPTADEAALRPLLEAIGALSSPLTQTFTSWDNLPSLQAFYDMAGGVDVKARANAIATALVGNGAGALQGAGAGANGPFKVQAQVLHRTNAAVVVVIALTPTANYAGTPLFVMSDTAGGSAVAQFGDANAIQCEVFQPSGGNVDFLFVVDNSCSMGAQQGALANTATAVAAALNNSQLNWRLALATTDYHLQGQPWLTNNRHRGFTRDINLFRSWLTVPVVNGNPVCDVLAQNGGAAGCGQVANGWVGIGGSGQEGILGAARQATLDLGPASAAEIDGKVRQGAQLVVVLLGDADDQSTGATTTAYCTRGGPTAEPGTYDPCENVTNFLNFFQNANGVSNGLGKVIPVHGIVCPASGVWSRFGNNNYGFVGCGEDQAKPQRHGQVVTATGGVRGSISDLASISVTINAILNSAIAANAYRLQKPPIGASVKVAMSDVQTPAMCDKNDVPRSRQNGFDFDGVNRTLAFYGACRPSAATNQAAVSYRYWIDTTPNPGGNPPPCSTDTTYYDPNDPDFCKGRLACNFQTNQCECPSNCGGNGPPGKVCNPNKLVCDFVCTSDCGGTCTGFQQCNVGACGCECVQSASCALGYKFQNGAGVCGCVCDTGSLNCGSTYDADPNSCSCVCKPNCGGCALGLVCNPSTCSCGGGIN